MRICNLREKQVINSVDCKILGYVQDVEFDLCSGCIKAIIVPGECWSGCYSCKCMSGEDNSQIIGGTSYEVSVLQCGEYKSNRFKTC